MLSFASDYTEGACEEILQKLAETNRESLPDMAWTGTARVPPEKYRRRPDARRRRFIFWWAVPRRMRS